MKIKLLCALSLISFNALALTSMSFKEDETLELNLSKNEYNRVYVLNDKIKGAHFSDKNLSIQNEPDGSVYIDMLQDLSATIFFDTQKGHHFALTIKPEDSLGKTVKLIAKPAITPAKTAAKDTKYEQVMARIVRAMQTDTVPEGYTHKKLHSRYQNLGGGLRKKQRKALIGDSFIGEVIEVYNGSRKSIQLDEKWFANIDTKAVSLSQNALAPKHSTLVYVVKESAHG